METFAKLGPEPSCWKQEIAGGGCSCWVRGDRLGTQGGGNRGLEEGGGEVRMPQSVARGGGRDFHIGIRESSETGVTVCEIRFQWGLGGDRQGILGTFIRWGAYLSGKVIISSPFNIMVDLVSF